MNDEIVLFGGIRKFYFLNVNTAKSNCCSQEEKGGCSKEITMINQKEFFMIDDDKMASKWKIKI